MTMSEFRRRESRYSDAHSYRTAPLARPTANRTSRTNVDRFIFALLGT